MVQRLLPNCQAAPLHQMAVFTTRAKNYSAAVRLGLAPAPVPPRAKRAAEGAAAARRVAPAGRSGAAYAGAGGGQS